MSATGGPGRRTITLQTGVPPIPAHQTGVLHTVEHTLAHYGLFCRPLPSAPSADARADSGSAALDLSVLLSFGPIPPHPKASCRTVFGRLFGCGFGLVCEQYGGLSGVAVHSSPGRHGDGTDFTAVATPRSGSTPGAVAADISSADTQQQTPRRSRTWSDSCEKSGSFTTARQTLTWQAPAAETELAAVVSAPSPSGRGQLILVTRTHSHPSPHTS